MIFLSIFFNEEQVKHIYFWDKKIHPQENKKDKED